jgi:von Willebrand factor type A C-terminal domain/von Willebrand factor type A domain
MTRFVAETYQNEYLSVGASDVNAVVTVTALGGAAPAEPAEAAEIVIVDMSGSMALPATKLREAKNATVAAIDCIRDGVSFAVVSGATRAHSEYPIDRPLAVASPVTRQAAKSAVAGLFHRDGTCIGRWLSRANELFDAAPYAIRHAILLTDGRNEGETPEQLDAALARCEGRFQCDCRGVGTDWEVGELRRIASTLLGTVDIVADPAGLAADFAAMIDRAMTKQVNNVSLRLWTPRGASVAFVKQVSPTIEDLTGRARPVDELTAEYPTGAWGGESRDYHVCIRVQAREVGDEMAAGRFSLVVDGEVAGQALIKAIWTDDEQLSTRISREVAHYTGQSELADAIQEGLEARRVGDEQTATFKLGRAVQLAADSGNDGTMRLLRGVVDIDDPATGTVRLKRQVADADEMALDTRSTKTIRVGLPGP